MPRQTTLAARETILITLKEQAATLRNREKKETELKNQLEIATKAHFPKSALDALKSALKDVQTMQPDSELERKIDVLERWVAAEKSYQSLFAKPVRGAGAPRRKVGRPAKG